MTEYRISVSGCPDWRSVDICALEISMDNPKCDGDKFAALLVWAKEHFEFCVVNIGDTLQRHALAMQGLPESEAAEKARIAGDLWIERNARAIERHAGVLKICRWNDWIKAPDFSGLHEKIRAYYDRNDVFKAAVHRDINDFLARNPERLNQYGYDKMFACSFKYLMEELAGDIILSRQFKLARVYPAKRMLSYQHLSGHVVPEDIAGLGNDLYIHVNFKRRKSDSPESLTA